MRDPFARLHEIERGGKMRRTSDNRLPIGYSDALGWATIHRHQLGLAIECILAAASPSVNASDLGGRFWRSHEEKIEDLYALSRRRGLKIGWSRSSCVVADTAAKLDKIYKDSSAAPLYSRGAGPLDRTLRELSTETGINICELSMTVQKIDDLARSFRLATEQACNLAISILRHEPLSIRRDALRRLHLSAGGG